MPTKKSISRPTQRAAQNPVESRSNGNTSTHQPDEQFQDVHMRISERAYALFEEHGREEGHALEDWLKAEQQVGNKVNPPAQFPRHSSAP
jgi:Protein of unknown function (DUF2934)